MVTTWQRGNGERLWETDRLRYRRLSAPLVTDKGVVVVDDAGFIYLLSLADGALLNRISLDGRSSQHDTRLGLVVRHAFARIPGKSLLGGALSARPCLGDRL